MSQKFVMLQYFKLQRQSFPPLTHVALHNPVILVAETHFMLALQCTLLAPQKQLISPLAHFGRHSPSEVAVVN